MQTASSSTVQPQKIALKGQLKYLSGEDIHVAASLLFQSYSDDPLFRAIFKADKEGYQQRLRAAIREELNAFWQAKQPMIGLFEGDTLEGVACLTRPDQGFTAQRFWHWRLRMLLTAGYVSTRQLIEKEKQIEDMVPYSQYFMLAFIAVHPRYQHQGLGQMLVQAAGSMLAASPDAEGVVALATRPAYEDFLSQQGFQLLDRLAVGEIDGALMFYDNVL